MQSEQRRQLCLFTLTEATPPLLVDMTVNKVPLQMEVDTGASVSLISRDTYRKLWLNQEWRPKLQPSPRRLRTYTGQELDVQGSATVDVTYGSQSQKLPLLVVAGNGPGSRLDTEVLIGLARAKNRNTDTTARQRMQRRTSNHWTKKDDKEEVRNR